MTLILTNDDGIDAEGIKALKEALDDRHSIVAAPQQHLSGCGHQVTTQGPINVQRRSEEEYAIGGTPADCIRIAITHIEPNVKWVISGINSGGNMGVDSYISGTVAAVREAAFHGIPGIALSQYRKGSKPVNWQIPTRLARLVLANLFDRPLEPGSFWNVNFPYLEPEEPEPKIVFCQPSIEPLPVAYRVEGDDYFYTGKYGDRPYSKGTDIDVCFAGNIAVTKISL
ncbi:MAG: 5'/3'-nucleotidase SurE [Cyanobacteriota bacterium]|nr:5'/3'-nucleotidase SurE [Cyanobacteriota bacterium]